MMGADKTPLEALLLFTLLCCVLFAQAALDIQKKRIMIRKLDMCKGAEHLPMQWTNYTFGYNEESRTAMIGVNVKVLEEISTNFSMTFNFWKCDASGNPDSCEYVLKDYTNREICKYIAMKNQAWTIFVEHLEPSLFCPIKPGKYKLINCPLNTDFLRYLPISDAVWKIQFWGYDLEKTLSCVEMEMQIAAFLGGRRRGRTPSLMNKD